ncbi:MarR family transcriptional regulator [Paenibacillus glycanilyticus]|uniref:MarR family transcriptional regulator n=1 Tax=Paenibacillus glycanilyticus TaxID=126569 RepID=A0ABQ6G4W5_9BACL|nr:MarR family transcriptional regulator [Paenibacillus glycanilyticus]GLX65994.1 MarR family transcriptional regulator [Paenibacillus glycanilyticus]
MERQEQLIAVVRDLFNKLAWLNKFKMEDSLKGHTPSEVHAIEYIGKHADSNVTKLAESFYMTRSAISKMTKKLLEKELIESYQKDGNKKEIYFRLTEQGNAVNQIHEDLHEEFRKRDQAVFEQITKEQFDGMISLMERYSRHLDAEIKQQGIDAKSE